MTDTPAPDTISVPLFAEDFDLIHEALQMLAGTRDAAERSTDQIAELRDRLKRARLLP